MAKLKYESVQQQLQQRIRNAVIKPGERIANEMQLAKEFGVSTITIRKAMAGLVEAGYVTRTRGAGTFVAEQLPGEALQHAAAPAPHRRLIAMMLTQESYSSMSMTSILGGIQRTLTASGCDMLIDWNSTNPRISKENIVRMLEQHVDGFLIYPYDPTRNREEFQLISDAHLPYVLLDRYDPWRPSLYVGSNNFKGGMLAAEQLIAMGHKKICFCGSLFFLSSEQERYAGFAAAMRQAELPCDERNLMVTPDYDELARRTRAGELTALFCCSDRHAEKMVGEMMKRGIRIPEDLSIHGFDDNVYSPDNPVPLSTIHQSFEQIGQRAAELLLSTLEHDQHELQPVSVLVDVHPVVRASVRQLD